MAITNFDKPVGTEIATLNGKLTNLVKRKDFTFTNLSFSSGTIGTRGMQTYQDLELPTGSSVVGVYIYQILDSSLMNPLAFINGQSLYLNCYRATSSAMTNNEVRARVSYIEP